MNYGKSCDLINRSPPAERTTGSMASEREREYSPKLPIWQLRWPSNATCYTWSLIWRDNSNGSTAHARNSWGAIDPEPRPPLSPVPPRTMAGAFYPKSAGPPFSQTTSATTSRPSKTTYNAQIYRLALLVGDSKAKDNSFWIHFQSSLFQAKMCRRKKVLQESHHFGLLSWLPIGIAHPDGWTGRAAR